MSENLCDEVSEAYDIWSKSYDTNFNPTRDLTEVVLHSTFIDSHLADLENFDVLELGCGTGRNTEFFIEKYCSKIGKYVAVDISDGMMDLAKKKIDRLQIANNAKGFPK